jgi:hypothetical protein
MIHQPASLIAILALALVMALSPGSRAIADATDDTAKQAAVAAMQTWLAESDSGEYAKSWDDASKFFQKALSSAQWVQALTSVRQPLGKLVSRQLASSLLQTSTGASGMPKGTFVIAQFSSSFENLKSALETVTFKKESDGTWRAAGYYIKPD